MPAPKVSYDRKYLRDTVGKTLWFFRSNPTHAIRLQFGTALPPHQRDWVSLYFGPTKENDIVGSRGTSKSYSFGSQAPAIEGQLFKNITSLLFSASGFRGGKQQLRDSERLVRGQLKDQYLPGEYGITSIASNKVIQRDPSMWSLTWRSNSMYNTYPTNNADQLRGIRGNRQIVDERNTYKGEDVKTVLAPMLNVGASFRKTAQSKTANKTYKVSTIDYTFRDWVPEIRVAEALAQREFEAQTARREGRSQEYRRLMNENDGQLRAASFAISRVDYTDQVIPEKVPTLDGEKLVTVKYPPDPGLKPDDIQKVDDVKGMSFFYTYPVEVDNQEKDQRNGVADLDSWQAEQRNVFISASGNVFDFNLVQQVAEQPIPIGTKKDDDAEEWYAPVQASCGDPCVIGIDVAREQDETAFVVIRMGQLATGEFRPFNPKLDKQGRPCFGKTDFNHVCWAESHRRMPAGDVADRVRELMKRFNIKSTYGLPTLGMDKRGGGAAVRDELANPRPPVVNGVPDPTWSWDTMLKVYDPTDEDYMHYQAQEQIEQYFGGLRLLATTNADNSEWTFGARGLMQQSKLYLGYWRPVSQWATQLDMVTGIGEPDKSNTMFATWERGYAGMRALKNQQLRLQSKQTETGLTKFVMPGQRREAKKDLWAAFIYAVSLLREHLVALTRPEDDDVPMVQPMVVTFKSPWGGSPRF